MKKILVLLAVAFMAASAGYAQSAIELAKQQRELDKVNMDMLNAKPSKTAKKQAGGWGGLVGKAAAPCGRLFPCL